GPPKAVEDVVAEPAEQRIAHAAAREIVVAAKPTHDTGNIRLRGQNVPELRTDQVLDRVESVAGRLSTVVDLRSVEEHVHERSGDPVRRGVNAVAAVERITTGSADQRVAPEPPVQTVGSVVAGDVVITRTPNGILDHHTRVNADILDVASDRGPVA